MPVCRRGIRCGSRIWSRRRAGATRIRHIPAMARTAREFNRSLLEASRCCCSPCYPTDSVQFHRETQGPESSCNGEQHLCDAALTKRSYQCPFQIGIAAGLLEIIRPARVTWTTRKGPQRCRFASPRSSGVGLGMLDHVNLNTLSLSSST